MQIVTIKELSEFLKVKEKTIYQWSELRQIPCFKFNGCLRFDIQEIMQWMQQCKKDALSEYNPLSKIEARKGGTI